MAYDPGRFNGLYKLYKVATPGTANLVDFAAAQFL